MKKVIYVFSSSNFSGAEIVISRLILFNKDRITSIVICPSGKMQQMLSENGITTIICDSLSGLKRTENKYSWLRLLGLLIKNTWEINLLLLQTIKRESPSVLHSNNLTSSVYVLPGLLIGKIIFPKIKWIWSNHDINYLVDKQIGNKLSKILVYFFNKTLVVSKAVRISMNPTLTNKKIKILYNGIDLNHFKSNDELRNTIRQSWSITKESIVLAIIGTIADYKGQDLVIKSFLKLQTLTEKNIKLLIIGRIENKIYFDELRNMISTNINNDILFQDYSNNILDIYSGIDILINATKSNRAEPLGTTIIESMALKKITLASNTGGSVEIIDDKKNGYIFEADNENDLTEKLFSIIENYESQNPIKENAYLKIFNNFNIESMSSLYCKLIS